MSRASVAEVGVVIVGAGPHGLAVALHLLERDAGLREDLVVVDPSGGWLTTWHEQLARQDIAHLRSPGVHHPGPDPQSLWAWSKANGCLSGLVYDLPLTSAFAGHCDALVREARLEEHVVPSRVVELGADRYGTRLVLGDGSVLAARATVLAVNPCRPRVPPWAADLLAERAGAVVHGDDVDLRRLSVAGEHIVIVGGGLTAAHLAVGAADRGAQVTVVARRPLRSSMFDTDPGWLGPMYLDGFDRLAGADERLRACLAARDGGSVPPWMLRRLRTAESRGELQRVEGQRVCGMRRAGSRLELVLGDEQVLAPADRVWLATGTQVDVGAHPLTASLACTHPCESAGGWPLLDHALRWPGTGVHLVGRPAMLRMGPAAGNLWGARFGARRVADHVVGVLGAGCWAASRSG